MNELDALLRQWAAVSTGFLTSEATGRVALGVVGGLGVHGLARSPAAEAERLAFAAVAQVLREYAGWGGWPEQDADSIARALLAFETVQGWAMMTDLSPFSAGLSHSANEALTLYDAASRCDRIAEEFEIGDRVAVTCWFQAAHREAFRAVMRCPEILSGDDALSEEMIRVAAAAHISRLQREPEAVRVFGLAEVEAIPVVEAAVRCSSRRAIEQQKAQNQALAHPPR